MDVPNDLSRLKIGEIKKQVDALALEGYPSWIERLKQDPRKGVNKLADVLEKRQSKLAVEKEKIIEKKKIERRLNQKGYVKICGIDEVGRGPLAGPVVCAAVMMPEDSMLLHIDDSKKVSASRREHLAKLIKEEAIAWAIGEISPEQIDHVNILEATKEAMGQAVRQLTIEPDLLLIDALSIPSTIPVKPVIHGDAICYSIGAASIVAKVYRDHLMMALHQKYPQYGFDHNMGYGTAEHIAALKKYGPTPIHRRSFIAHIL